MKIHTADDITQYTHLVQMTLLFDETTQNIDADTYIDAHYPRLRNKVRMNKRPADLCGVSELTENWDKGSTDFSAYSVILKIIGYGIEYTPNEMIGFFTNVFPEFKHAIPKPLGSASTHKHREHRIMLSEKI